MNAIYKLVLILFICGFINCTKRPRIDGAVIEYNYFINYSCDGTACEYFETCDTELINNGHNRNRGKHLMIAKSAYDKLVNKIKSIMSNYEFKIIPADTTIGEYLHAFERTTRPVQNYKIQIMEANTQDENEGRIGFVFEKNGILNILTRLDFASGEGTYSLLTHNDVRVLEQEFELQNRLASLCK